jgi:hypothetical protein
MPATSLKISRQMKSSSKNDRVMTGQSLMSRIGHLHSWEWADLCRAVIELAAARIMVASARTDRFIDVAAGADVPASSSGELVARVRTAIGRTHSRVPWRADCLVQAVAAKRWLRRLGIETRLLVGVPARMDSGFEAHAWLLHGQEVVVGGDIGRYVSLTRPNGRLR